MRTYYCQVCAAGWGLVRPQIPTNVFLTPDQVKKYEKHTRGSSLSPWNGVFTDPSTLAYREVMVTAAAAGWFEINPRRLPSLVLTMDPPPGLMYTSGQFQVSANGIQLVLPHDPNRMHPFPIFEPGLEDQTCAGCGVCLDVIVWGSLARGDWRTFTSSG